ncbi:serine threonine-protein kinase BRI1-like [Seminavis robusta]|uniref:Serine threonine-protein kinase BRI1-like n=1 Tax=Seminavis robusta TaxID=568900 RepID=A0A9N8EIM6_9STRA|nr:serine threonine-protein kinase BRI1-like [Seminavis robusta]|eukprot:Sro1259_g256970.1 serine threonine-protein kinase BRI1-like (686) ;mRNA; r:29418-31658
MMEASPDTLNSASSSSSGDGGNTSPINSSGIGSHDAETSATMESPHRQSSMDVEQSLPTVAEVTGRRTMEHILRRRRRRRQSCILSALVVLVLALLALSIGLAVELSASNNKQSSSSQDNQQTAQTIMDSQKRYHDMVRFLSETSISSLTSLEDDSSPQHLALTFLALLDPLGLPIPHSHIIQEGYQFITRYVLTVLYFGMQGDSWTQKRHFLSNLPTCEWWELNLDESTRRQYKYVGVICNNNDIITNLILPNNNLHGELPTEMALLTTLKTLVLNVNQIHGSIPTTFKNLYWLEHLWLSHNAITGTVPNWIDSYVGIESLDLSYNRLEGELPAQLANLEHIQMIALDNNLLSGPIHDVFNLHNNSRGLQHLQFLYLESNRFSGSLGNSFMVGATESPLVALDVSDNSLTGRLPVHLFAQFPNLQVVDANSNQLIGQLPKILNTNNVLTFLAVHNNSLTGEVSGLLPNLHALTHLDVSSNTFTKWHMDIGAMTNLTYLFLANNPFPRGPFPSFLSSLTNLEELSLQATRRTGSIPCFLGSMTRLVLLDLENNQFTGAIPSDLGNLSFLQYFRLNRNQLSNSVPAELSNLLSLRLLFLDSNNLEGNLSSVVCNLRWDPMVVADCAADDSTGSTNLFCSCCDLCCSTSAPCNDDNVVPSKDPAWQFGYQRYEYHFGPTRHSISDAP